MNPFAAKNDARRHHRERDPKGCRRARAARKQYARNGAFGYYGQDSEVWRLCATGLRGGREGGEAVL